MATRTFLKGIALVALLCPSLTSAASCTGGTCLEDPDEVSFVQVKQVVKKKQRASAKAEGEAKTAPAAKVEAKKAVKTAPAMNKVEANDAVKIALAIKKVEAKKAAPAGKKVEAKEAVKDAPAVKKVEANKVVNPAPAVKRVEARKAVKTAAAAKKVEAKAATVVQTVFPKMPAEVKAKSKFVFEVVTYHSTAFMWSACKSKLDELLKVKMQGIIERIVGGPNSKDLSGVSFCNDMSFVALASLSCLGATRDPKSDTSERFKLDGILGNKCNGMVCWNAGIHVGQDKSLSPNHFAVVCEASGKQYVIDPTYGQFVDPGTKYSYYSGPGGPADNYKIGEPVDPTANNYNFKDIREAGCNFMNVKFQDIKDIAGKSCKCKDLK